MDVLSDMLKSTKSSYLYLENQDHKSYQDQRRLLAFVSLAKKLEDPQHYRFEKVSPVSLTQNLVYS